MRRSVKKDLGPGPGPSSASATASTEKNKKAKRDEVATTTPPPASAASPSHPSPREERMLKRIKREEEGAEDLPPGAAGTSASISDLPDDILVRLFGLLDSLFVADVVGRVCRKWRALASDAALWHDVTLTYRAVDGVGPAAAGRMARALAAAPLLEGLEVALTDGDPPMLRRALEASATEVRHLSVDVEVKAEAAAGTASAAGVVLRLLSNSRRCLEVLCLRESPWSRPFAAADALRFWQLVEQCSQLRVLVLFLGQHGGLVDGAFWFKPKQGAASSLRTLFVDVGVLSDGAEMAKLDVTLETLIAAHRDTLRQVSLPRLVHLPRALSAVAKCLRVQRVRVPASRDARLLAGCPELHDLCLTFDLDGAGVPAEALAALQAVPLAQVRLDHLRARPPPGLWASLEPLTRLHRLQELSMTSLPPAALLERLPLELEALRLERACDAEGCRLPAFRELLRRHARLHVVQASVDLGPDCDADHRSVVSAGLELPVAFVGHGHGAVAACAFCTRHRQRGGGVFHFDCLDQPDEVLRAEGISVWHVSDDQPAEDLAGDLVGDEQDAVVAPPELDLGLDAPAPPRVEQDLVTSSTTEYTILYHPVCASSTGKSTSVQYRPVARVRSRESQRSPKALMSLPRAVLRLPDARGQAVGAVGQVDNVTTTSATSPDVVPGGSGVNSVDFRIFDYLPPASKF